MARFYGRFDSGSGGWVTALDTDGFDKLRVSTTSASAALLRDGLITSRSALSAAMFTELNADNRSGANGPIIPRNVVTQSAGTLQWTNVYTSTTIPGIVIPADFRTRPTASVLVGDANLTPASPADPGSINNDLYLSASAAVNTILVNTQNGAGTAFTPYIRSGSNPSRTLHSIWHDKDIQYFGWDDFTPGLPSQTTPTVNSIGNCAGAPNFYVQPTLRVYYGKEFSNDFNTDGKIDISIKYTSNNGGSTQFDSFTGVNISGSGTSGNYRYYEFQTAVLSEGTGFGDDTINYDMQVTMSFLDATIPTSRGAYSYFGPYNFVNCACASNGSPCI